MSQPNKNEQKRIDSLYRQLQKMDESIRSNLAVYLEVNGRDQKVKWAVYDALEHIGIATEKLKPYVSEVAEN